MNGNLSRVITALVVVCFSVLSHGSVQAESLDRWPRFRGHNGSGLAPKANCPNTWQADQVAWKYPLPGTGNSSPVVWDSRIYVTSANQQAQAQFLTCLDLKTGRRLWSHEFSFSPYKKHKNNSFASSTPAVDEHHVYTIRHLPDGALAQAWTHDGAPVWKFNLGPFRNGQGGASSPIVMQELVVISNDHGRGSRLLALNRMTGELKWEIPREGKRACYSTPCVIRLPDGRQQLVFTHCFEGIIGVDPETGRTAWHIDVFGDFPQRAVGSPFVAHGLILANSGAAGGERNLVAVRTDGQQVEEVYRLQRGAPHVPTAIAHGQHVFSWADNGILTCIDAKTGANVWQKRVGGSFFGSPICVGDKLINVDLDGRVVVLSATGEYEVLGRTELGEETKATPAWASDTLLIRTDQHLWAIRADSVSRGD